MQRPRSPPAVRPVTLFSAKDGRGGDSWDPNKPPLTRAEYKELPEKGIRGVRRYLSALCGPLLPPLWFALVFLIAHPLANGPVADSWIYLRAVARWNAGSAALPGFTAAMPLLQLAYGMAWSRWFGLSYVSLYWSVIWLGIAGAILFYLLARRCQARALPAAAATALLVINPCYLFLSFSFMTDVPYVVLLIAAFVMFASAPNDRAGVRLWLCAALLVAAFTVRVFALAAIAGCAGTVWLRSPSGTARRRLLPFAVGGAACIFTWFTLARVMPVPWMLEFRANRMRYLAMIPAAGYLNDAFAAPLLYLGLVLSPLAIPHLISARWRRGLAIAAAVGVVVVALMLSDPGGIPSPELSCCGGWDNVLVLRGPQRFVWTDAPLRLAMKALAILGIAGLALAAGEIRKATPAFLAVMLSTAIYWAGTIPLWLFNDRYYLAILPAGCLLLALAPCRRGIAAGAVGLVLAAALGWFAAAGVYDQQRGLEAVMTVRDDLVRHGVPRSAIDAGYPLNGNDLYRDPQPGQPETFAMEAGIPLITTGALKLYTLAAAPIADSEIVRRFGWPGVSGFGRRTLYLLKTQPAGAAAHKRGKLGQRTASTPPGLALALTRLVAITLMLAAPPAAVLLWLA
jgi:hypothetical protein